MKEPRRFPLRVLFVEDEEPVRHRVTRILNRHVEAIYMARDGLEGLKLFRTERPDVVISDIQMPKMDGFGLFRHIRKQDRHIPLVLFTGHHVREFREEAASVGVDQYLLKPLSRELLIQVLEHSHEMIEYTRRLRERLTAPAAG